jgi:hypothetical protein
MKGQQNQLLIFGRNVKYEKSNLYHAVSYLNPLAVTAPNKVENNNQLRHVRPYTGFQVPLTGEICVLHSTNSIVLTSIKILYFSICYCCLISQKLGTL